MPGAHTGRAETGQRGLHRVTPAKKALGPAILVVAAVSLLAAFAFLGPSLVPAPPAPSEKPQVGNPLRIGGMVEKGQSLSENVKRHNLAPPEKLYYDLEP